MASREMALGTSAEAFAPAAVERGLVELCRQGDAEAFARLVSLHESMVYNLAARLLGDPEEARDLSQDVFLQVYRTLARFQGRSTLKTWIYRIVVNQCRNRQRWWRRRRRDRSCPIDALTAADEARMSAHRPAETPYDALRRAERQAMVQAALLKVSFDHRAILLLREVEGLSCEEIAQALAVPEGTVKSRLARARDALRRGLSEARR
ncbi:MAG TPA: sigma-70 family RNA polymerase sigma factor [Vicinamibacteria bacterium]|nr:sigma-70 family RNA polymerase sigma factor [Vicinamibacteria bacterium]